LLNKQLLATEKRLNNIVNSLNEVATSASKVNTELAEQSSSFTKLNKTTKKAKENTDILAESEKELTKIEEKQKKIIAQARAERAAQGKQLTKTQLLRQKQNKAIKETIKLEKAEIDSIARLRAENKKLIDSRNNLSTSTKEGAKEIESINKQIAKNNDSIKKNSSFIEKKIKLDELQVKITNSEKGSIERLRLENRKLTESRNKVSASTEEGREEISAFNKQININNDIIKENSDVLSQNKQNIGNYASATEGLNDALSGLPSQFQAAIQGVKGLGKQFIKLLKNPIVLIIAGVVAGLAALVGAFKKTQGGADTFAKTFKVLNDVVGVIIGRLGKLATAISKFIKGDISFKELGKESKDAFTGLREEIDKTVKESSRIFELTKAFELQRIAATKSIAELGKVAEIQAAIADDATKSFQERQAAAQIAEEAIIAQRKEELELAKSSLQILQSENNLAQQRGQLTRELSQQEADQIAIVTEAEKNLSLSRIESSKRRAELAQDNFEQELDFLLDVSDAQKTVNERQIGNQEIAFERRKEILAETKTLLDDSFTDQLALFEQAQQVQLDVNKLLTLNNKEVFEYARGLGLSEIATNRLLEVIKERRFALQDLADAEKDLNVEGRERAIQLLEQQSVKESQVHQERLINFKGTNEQYIEIAQSVADSLLDIERRRLEAELELTKIGSEQRFAIEQQLFNMRLDLANQEVEEKAKKKVSQDEIDQQSQELKIELANQLFELGSAFRERELADIDTKRQQELELAGDNAVQKDAINKKYDAQRSKILRKQAIADKAQALFNISINTAQAITSALKAGPIAGPILAALVGALGVAQAATVIAKPIPKFKKGVKDFQGGMAVVGDGGQELIRTDNGMFLTPSTDTLVNLPKGADVIPHHQTNELLKGGLELNHFAELVNEQKKTRHAIKSQYSNNLNITHRGMAHTRENQDTKITYIDNYLR